MKTITTMALLLCSIVVYGQKGIISNRSLKGYYQRDTTKSFNPILPSGQSAFIIEPKKPDYYSATSTKTMIKVSSPDSAGFVKVWLNRKEIYWLSDSTFIYKTN